MSKPGPRNPLLGRLLAFALLAGLLALVGIQLVRSQRGIVTRGEPAPAYSLTTFEGETITSEQLAGKVVVINIWASWCIPCEQEAEALQAAWELYEPRGDVVFLGVDYVDTQKEALAYLERFSITYPNGPDLGSAIYTGFRARGVPETFVINKRGEVAGVKIGPFEDEAELTNMIDLLLETDS